MELSLLLKTGGAWLDTGVADPSSLTDDGYAAAVSSQEVVSSQDVDDAVVLAAITPQAPPVCGPPLQEAETQPAFSPLVACLSTAQGEQMSTEDVQLHDQLSQLPEDHLNLVLQTAENIPAVSFQTALQVAFVDVAQYVASKLTISAECS